MSKKTIDFKVVKPDIVKDMIHLTATCPKCGQVHITSSKELELSELKIICYCGEVFLVSAIVGVTI